MENNKKSYDWEHKFINKLAGICQSHHCINLNVKKDEKLKYISNASSFIVDFLNSAIRYDYDLPHRWTKEILIKAHRDALELKWEDFDKVNYFIDTYCSDFK